jgi:hypothetical protein
MLSQPQFAVHQQAAKLFQRRQLKRSYEVNSAFEKADKLLEQSVPAVNFTIFRHYNIMSQPVLAFTPRNIFFFNDKSEQPLKNSKTSRDPDLGQDLTIHVNKSHIHLVIQSLKGALVLCATLTITCKMYSLKQG